MSTINGKRALGSFGEVEIWQSVWLEIGLKRPTWRGLGDGLIALPISAAR